MGADFYIVTYLKIEHLYGTTYYELQKRKCEFHFSINYYDSDTDEWCSDRQESTELYERYQTFVLKPRKPIYIFEHSEFSSESLKKKYEPIIAEVRRYGSNLNRSSECEFENIGSPLHNIEYITRITKVESRYLRE